MIFVKIAGIGSDEVTTVGYDDGTWLRAESLAFGADRDIKESGEKGGTADINIGVGRLSSVVITKFLDDASGKLAQFAVNGNSPGSAEIHVLTPDVDSGLPLAFLKYELDRSFVKSWSTAGEGDGPFMEDVALYYNRIAFQYRAPDAAPSEPFRWDKVTSTAWTDHGITWPEPKGPNAL